MKQIYLFLATFLCCNITLLAQTSVSNVGTAVIGVPEDYKNDLWLNTHFREMSVGETYKIVARRVPEIVDNPFGNNITLPNTRYTVEAGSSVSVTDEGVVTALSLGTSIISVRYDELVIKGHTYPAVSEVNVTYFAVDVIDPEVDAGITLQTDISTRTYDTHYFTEGESTIYSFSVSAEGATNTAVFCNGSAASFNEGIYTVALQNRANIIEVVATNTNGTKKLYYVIDARKIEITIQNQSNSKRLITVGDKVKVSFHGIVIPVYKLATIYNPTFQSSWGGEYTRVKFDNDLLGTVQTNDSKIGQYTIADHNSITFTVSEPGVHQFTNGRIFEAWWGSPLGTEKDRSGPGNPHMGAPMLQSDFSSFPNFEVVAYAPLQPAKMNEFTLAPETFLMTDAPNAVGETVTEVFNSGSFAFKNSVTNWGGMTSWYGVAISNQTDNVAEGSHLNQYTSAAGGDVDATGNYAVVFDMNSGGMSMGSDAAITFNITDQAINRQVSGCYVTNNTYVLHSMQNGDGFAKKFGGADGNDPDYYKLTATGLDKEGLTTGSLDFYLADFRFDDNSLDYFVEDWTWFDLSELGRVASVTFSLSSSDVGDYGMNTPAYFCIDNLGYQRLKTLTPLADVKAKDEDADMEIDLSSLFTDVASPENVVVNTIHYNSNEASVISSIIDNKLLLDFVSPGTSNLIVKGKYKGMSITDTMTIIVTADASPWVAKPIEDVVVDADSEVISINVSATFTDPDDNDGDIIKTVKSNSNPALVSTELQWGWNLKLNFTPGLSGQAEIVIEAESNGKTVTETFTVTVSPVTSLGKVTLQDVVVHPNPSNGIFRIQAQATHLLDVKIYSITGRRVYANPNYLSNGIIDISQQSPGQYILKLSDGASLVTRSFIIK